MVLWTNVYRETILILCDLAGSLSVKLLFWKHGKFYTYQCVTVRTERLLGVRSLQMLQHKVGHLLRICFSSYCLSYSLQVPQHRGYKMKPQWFSFLQIPELAWATRRVGWLHVEVKRQCQSHSSLFWPRFLPRQIHKCYTVVENSSWSRFASCPRQMYYVSGRQGWLNRRSECG